MVGRGFVSEGMKILKKRWYVIPLFLVVIIILIPVLQFANEEISIVKIATEYGTLELSENVGITQKNYIIRTIETVDDTTYTVFYLSSEASVVEVSGFVPLSEEHLPVGVQSGHDVLFVFDNDATTEEALFFDITVDIGGVVWDQAIIYSGTGQQLKVFILPPQQTTGNFFLFFYQSEVERNWPSLLVQLKGYHESQARNVFITTYYSLTYSYISPPDVETTNTSIPLTTKNPLVASNIDVIHVLGVFISLVYVKKHRKREDIT